MRKLVLFGVVAVLSFTFAGHASAQQVYWKTKTLAWNGGSLTKSFTASQADTAFLTLPDDIAWNVFGTAAQAQTVARLTFYCPTAAANADTVRYTVQPAMTVGSSLIYPFTDYRDRTAGVTNAATVARAGGSGTIGLGLVFAGQIQFNSTGITNELPFILPKGSRLKVQGDPNGALANLRAQITYPSYIPN
jgi:hypothetical protein